MRVKFAVSIVNRFEAISIYRLGSCDYVFHKF